jgi:hypothetical protein
MPNTNNIYDLVERAAARRRVPRLELWQEAAKALVEGRLHVINRFEKPFPGAPVKSYDVWLREFAAAINWTSDPNDFRRILKRIIVLTSDFAKWLNNAPSGSRGPQPGTTGYQATDRKLFPKITRLIKAGRARSAYGAALLIADEIAGSRDERSKAKRVSAAYRKQQRHNR